jgi:hypothetical protein
MSNYAAMPLPRRLAAVVMTYTTRPLIWWTAGVGCAVVLFAVLLSGGLTDPDDVTRRGGWQAWLGMAPVIFGAVLCLQSKSHFVTPAARITPNYRTPHLATTAALAIAFLALGAVAYASALGLAPIGSAALAIFVGSLTVWAFHIPLLWLPLIGAVLALSEPLYSRFWIDPSVNATPIRLLILCAGWVFFASWLRALASMQEERDDYLIPPLAAAFRRPSRNERAEQRKIAARQLNRHQWMAAWVVDRRIDRALSSGGLSAAELVRLGFCAQSALTRALYLCVLFGGMWFAMLEWKYMAAGGVLFQVILFSGFMPGTAVFGLIDAKRSQLEGDLMRPMLRSQYYSALVAGYLRDLTVGVAAFCLLTIVFVSIYLPERLSVATTLAFVAQATTSNLLWFAGNYRLASSFSAMARMAILYVPLAGVIGINAWLWNMLEDFGVGPIVACSFVYAAIAVLTLRAAHRRWLNVEVG